MSHPHTVLVVGGAGYIGSHMVHDLTRRDCRAIVLDNLIGGHRGAVQNAMFIQGDIGDPSVLDHVFSTHHINAVMHFASFIQVGESVTDPGKYYDNNVARTITLLNAMTRHHVPIFIFSSTAAIFGTPEYVPIDEQHPARPINPYGRSKWLIESLLEDYHTAYGLRYGCLRYFNAAGADAGGGIGECHEPETHLIPLILQVASGRRESVTIFGADYDTPDGTCIRDYVHVTDLADAHWRLLNHLESGKGNLRLNLGTGTGYSVLQVIEAARRITGHPIPAILSARRPGDPAALIADGAKARQLLGWNPSYSELDTLIADAWKWEQRLCKGAPF